MAAWNQKANEVFLRAIDITSDEARDSFLADACGADGDLRHSVETLLKAHATAGTFLASPVAVDLDPPILLTPPGTVIGRYKILERIGEGGYGTVFMAEQTTPVQRKVALKIIKAGMDTRQVIARFEAERQALALMDHPNIAKVFDAGVTETGRPYFVMELVKGVPITKYCDEHHVQPRQRLELFVQVCQAVQHAHTKGIIHRDLKPTNVLVAQYDGKPVPKVIDFGVAKATGQQLTDLTMFTGFGDVIGTLEYMSPEQAEVNQLDVDTRSDIYSLGVLLYELLTGSTPLEHKRVMKAGLLEMLRVVREEEPPRPSTRLSTSEQLPSISANRGLEPKKLSGLVKGELDWIVMKALEKDRTRRYETANGLAADVQRYLADEPVQACPPSARYRFRKFARRNKGALAASGLVLFFLVLVGSGIGWTVRDRTARTAKVSGQLELILIEVARLEQGEKWSEALASARRAEPALASGEAAPGIQERVRQALADLQLVARIEEIRAESGTVWGPCDGDEHIWFQKLAVQADRDYTVAFRQAGIDVDALPVEEAVDRIRARRPIAAALLPALDDWVAVRTKAKGEALTRRMIHLLQAADPDPWRRQVRDAVARKDWTALENLARSADLEQQPAATLSSLYAALHATHRALGIEVLRRAQRKYPADYWINHRLGVNLISAGKEDVVEGMGYLRVAVALRPQSAHSAYTLGKGYDRLMRYDDAVACYQKAIELSPRYVCAYVSLGQALKKKGQYVEAVACLREAVKLLPQEPMLHNNLAWILATSPDATLRDPDEAVKLARRAVELYPDGGTYWNTLGAAQYRAGDFKQAAADLKQSTRLGDGGNSADFFFLAMAHWKLGDNDLARTWFAQGVEWMDKNSPKNEELLSFRAEAAELLKITGAKPTTKPQP